jgi:hypothetical protein
MGKSDEMKEKLFGGVGRIKATGGHQVDLKKLLKPLEWEKGIMRVFCEGCGSTLEVDRFMAEVYVRIANVELPESPEKFYFKSRGCGLCDRVDNVRPVELIPIPGYAKGKSPVGL